MDKKELEQVSALVAHRLSGVLLQNLPQVLLPEIKAQIAAALADGTIQERWMELPEAMKYAKVKSRTTMMNWINAGKVQAFKRSGKWIVDRQSIDNWYTSGGFLRFE